MFLLMAVTVGASYFVSSVTDDHQRVGAVWMLSSVVALFLPIPVHFVGFVLGVVSIFFSNRRKLFPVVGALLNLVLGIGSIWPWLYLAWNTLGRVQ